MIPFVALVIGIKLETVDVPQYAIKDGSQTLKCQFKLESDTLLVLKWYKDGHEFFRYSPQNSPQTMVFPVNGVYVDVSLHTQSKQTFKCVYFTSIMSSFIMTFTSPFARQHILT